MSDERDIINSMKRSLIRFNTDERFAMAVKRCTAELLLVCDDIEDCADAMKMVIVMVKENWDIDSMSQFRSQKEKLRNGGAK